MGVSTNDLTKLVRLFFASPKTVAPHFVALFLSPSRTRTHTHISLFRFGYSVAAGNQSSIVHWAVYRLQLGCLIVKQTKTLDWLESETPADVVREHTVRHVILYSFDTTQHNFSISCNCLCAAF